MHDGHGHFGVHSTAKRLRSQYWWPSYYDDVREYLSCCHACQVYSKSKPPKKPVHPIEVQNLFELWGIDFVGKVTKSANDNIYILVCTEYFTKWPLARACKANDAETVAKFLYEEVFTVFGPPKSLLSDRGPEFRNALVDAFCEKVKTNHHTTTAYNPQCNGLTERFNRTLVTSLEKIVADDPSHWDVHIPAVLWAYCTRIHSSINKRPFEVMYGVPLRSTDSNVQHVAPVELRQLRQNSRAKAEAVAARIRQRQHLALAALTTLDEGTQVLLYDTKTSQTHSKKFLPKWKGPFVIAEVLPFNNYRLVDLEGNLVPKPVNGNRVKIYRDVHKGGDVTELA